MKLLKQIKGFIPRKLPIGLTSFNRWVKDLIDLSGLPDNETTRKVAATFILRLDPNTGYVALRRVSNQLVKIASNQVACEVLKSSDEQLQKTTTKVV